MCVNYAIYRGKSFAFAVYNNLMAVFGQEEKLAVKTKPTLTSRHGGLLFFFCF